ncbi:hypothetical protein M8C21_026076 [Ambrosia artemisiifolia]|uniref:RING-type E3 ubiquitin transferase n=1 Tax=Ambrosia artemisiifolia TaxID=4212 RepID=A0AAD5G2G8_AMBAR|nr:hypothetical protein M8C21_026076 [Ambrosia artemisiifolia]
MENELILRLIFFSSFLLTSISATDNGCRPASCGPREPVIRFPFRLTGRQPLSCGYPGFELSCNRRNRTIIRLPSSRSHLVNRINYVSQVIYIDPGFCQQKKINGFNLTDTPFEFSNIRSYIFYNCTYQNIGFMYPAVPFPCLSGKNYSVIAVRSVFTNQPVICEVIKAIDVPTRWNGDIKSELELMWFTPVCRGCELEGRGCGLKNEDGEIGCIGSSHGFPRSATYGLSLGIGVPVSVCLIGLICYAATRARNYSETRHQSMDLFSIGIIPQPSSRTGLDQTTIESYPKTTLGESCRLPTEDNTCAICLSDYKPKESLRTIPECNHYFHADCIDEWLKLNATCPVCRNTPESSSLVTPCSSTSTTSSLHSS